MPFIIILCSHVTSPVMSRNPWGKMRPSWSDFKYAPHVPIVNFVAEKGGEGKGEGKGEGEEEVKGL